MCKRYVSPDERSIEREFDLIASEWEFPANYNVAPAQAVPVIRVVDDQPEPVLLNWGFGAQGTFNLPMEMLNLDAGERSLLAQGRRCIMPALGFYEWHTRADGFRQPFYIHTEDQPLFGFAALWERDCCALITVPANAMMTEIDPAGGRMPAILARDQREVWLYGTATRAAAALRPYPIDVMVAYAVTARVDFPANNDETLIEPLQTDVD